MTFDCIILGGGIIGASTAWQLQQRFPGMKILLLEKEEEFARHQTGHNSGVVHAGVYYEPGSLKSRFCKAGATATRDFCAEHKLPFDRCGKLLVATTLKEQQRLQELLERCQLNAIQVEQLDARQLRELEPNIIGSGALLVPDTAIVDYRQIASTMVSLFIASGGNVRLNHQALSLQESTDRVTVVAQRQKGQETIHARFLISCTGLQADRTARMLGLSIDFQIIPFRGEYYQLPSQLNQIIKHLIYPVPDPTLPFLGIHLTRMIDGTVTVGPNAVLGWKREGYARFNSSLGDSWEMLTFSGFWRLLQANLHTGLAETRDSFWKPGYLKRVQRYCPQLKLSDLLPYPAGIRAQAVLNDGTLVHDFLFAESPRSLHVCNAPSPAATAAIPIGSHICDKATERMKHDLTVRTR
jgi:L-2-hydroxyglutarate oxidase